MTKRYVVFHRSYGCDTGCCGHAIALLPEGKTLDEYGSPDDDELLGSFQFDHPYTDSEGEQKEWAEAFLRTHLKDHAGNLAWEESRIFDD